MKKRMITSFLWWLWMLLLLAGVTIFTDSSYGFAGCILWITLPVLTWGINFYVRNYLTLKIDVTPTASKSEEKQVTLILHNTSTLAVGKAICQMEFHNTLTGEKQLQILEMPIRAKGSSKGQLQMMSAHCGYIQMEVKMSVLTDCFGFLPVKCKLKANRKVDILPDIFQTQISLQIPSVTSSEEENWSQEWKGEDYAEVFALRDYAEGDSLKQIHWKLSSKKNALIVKEGSFPITKSVLVFWDKNALEAKPEEMDAMAEVVASISQSVMETGIPFTLGWTENTSCVLEEIQSEDVLIQVLPRMLKSGSRSEERDFWKENLQEKNRYGKILYFAKGIPEYIEEIKDTDITFLLCTREKMQEGIWTFTPETYMQDMAALEL
jgi:uncharacterized protein (DUF58 family)